MGIPVERVLTDNGNCYRSKLMRDVLGEAGVIHKRTRPYHPQTNGKVERLNLTLKHEWAYIDAYPDNQRLARGSIATTTTGLTWRMMEVLPCQLSTTSR
jgi:transposase InsO family protein